MREDTRDAMRTWLSPQVVLPVLAFVGGLWVSAELQQERIEALTSRIESFERDYQRRAELAIELRAVDRRLSSIESKLDANIERRAAQ